MNEAKTPTLKDLKARKAFLTDNFGDPEADREFANLFLTKLYTEEIKDKDDKELLYCIQRCMVFLGSILNAYLQQESTDKQIRECESRGIQIATDDGLSTDELIQLQELHEKLLIQYYGNLRKGLMVAVKRMGNPLNAVTE